MGLRINTNVVSVTAQKFLGQNTRALNRALERLSSGSRINRAGDDAAGLAVSEGIRAQLRGIRQAIRNANDAAGFLNTAEGGLTELTNIAQRLRELAIQSANGALSPSDRSYLSDEAVQLLEEFERIATQTEFNGVKLLNGTFQDTNLQVGINQGETIAFTLGDARSSVMGAIAAISGAQHYLGYSNTGTYSLTLNGQTISLTDYADYDDDSPSGTASFSAKAIAGAINSQESLTNVRAQALTTFVRIENLSFASFSSSVDGDLTINGHTISTDGLNSGSTVNDLITEINKKSNSTGVKARLVDGSTDDIELYATDGRNIQLVVATSGGTITEANGFWNVFNGAANYGAISALVEGLTSAAFLSGQGLNRVFTGAVKLTSLDAIQIAGTGSSHVLGFSATSVAIDPDTAINSVDISSQSGATDALEILDKVLSQIADLRGGIGAVQNRLDVTVSNLSTTIENLSAAFSQVRDADIALETAELTRAQILQQAGVAVLAQANTTAQAALQLLQF